jgi:hypothetical protein
MPLPSESHRARERSLTVCPFLSIDRESKGSVVTFCFKYAWTSTSVKYCKTASSASRHSPDIFNMRTPCGVRIFNFGLARNHVNHGVNHSSAKETCSCNFLLLLAKAKIESRHGLYYLVTSAMRCSSKFLLHIAERVLSDFQFGSR